ncbi:MAG: hypothetical protein HYV15_04895 [Elusimicrobia bacterium]|nr:hypothetical protein [Elusimicrobiota bacterium]
MWRIPAPAARLATSPPSGLHRMTSQPAAERPRPSTSIWAAPPDQPWLSLTNSTFI